MGTFIEYPENLSRFYDIIYHYHRDGVDNAFYLKEIKSSKGRVLEAGVGTGRLFMEALSQGADMWGLDISSTMIEVLLEKLDTKHHHRISRQNIITFKYDHKFDLIIAPFRVFMHLLDKDDQMKALDNAYSHLNNGGKFIFDAFIPDLNQLLNGVNNWNDFTGEYKKGKELRRFVTTKPDLINQVINVSFHLEWDTAEGKKIEDWDAPLRYFFRYELEHLLERSPFEEYTIKGDFEGHPLNQESKEFVILCFKR